MVCAIKVVQISPSSWRASCPAKLNLFLEVLGRRADGFHEIETLMIAVDPCDTLELSNDPMRHANRISFQCRWAWAAGPMARQRRIWGQLPANQENLALRGLQLLKDRAGVAQGAGVELIKRIPAEAGLGGASSNAAAALAVANAAWNLHWPVERLSELAAELGSDVPFFLSGGAAVARGRGDKLSPATRVAAPFHVVIFKPPFGLSTAEVYSRCAASPRPRSSTPLRDALRRGQLVEIIKHQWNQLEQPACDLRPQIRQAKQLMTDCGAKGAQMSGSGSSVFGWCLNARHARRVGALIRQRAEGAVLVGRTWASHSPINAA